MENDKIIDWILNEWAMRSPDGLVGGYSGKENMVALYETLIENNFEEHEIFEVLSGLYGEADAQNQVDAPVEKRGKLRPRNDEHNKYMFFDRNNPRIIKIYNRDRQKFDYEDGEVYPHEVNTNIRMKLSSDAPRNISNARIALGLETDEDWRKMITKKQVTQGNVDRMKAAIDKYTKDKKNTKAVEIFRKKFDKYPMKDIDDAIAFYSGTSPEGREVKELIDYIDDGTAKAPTGRGEMVFVYILQNMTSGGNKMMDLVIAEARDDLKKFGRDQGIEVKEAKNKVIGISLPTLKGYTQSDLYKALTELINLVHKFGDNLYASFVSIIDTSTEDSTKKDEYKNELHKFFDDPKSGEVSMTLIQAMLVISTVVRASVPQKKDGVMDIEIGGEETEFDIKNVEKVKRDIDVAKSKSNDNVQLNVVAKYSKSMPTEDMEAEMRKIKFFKEQITEEKLNAMVTKLMTDKYSKLLVVNKSAAATSDRAVLYTIETMNQLRFGYLGFGKLYLLLPGGTSSDISKTTKDAGEEEANQA